VKTRTSKSSAPRRVYLDTSAYLCVLLGEEGSKQLEAEIADAEVLSSVLLVLETRRNLIRLARDGTLKSSQYAACVQRLNEDIELMVLRDLTFDLCGSALMMPAIVVPRSLDLAHLQTALWFDEQEAIGRFLTLDRVQQEAAKELGLPV
jgi:PIN domain nuclease of toxin-antitoxin system